MVHHLNTDLPELYFNQQGAEKIAEFVIKSYPATLYYFPEANRFQLLFKKDNENYTKEFKTLDEFIDNLITKNGPDFDITQYIDQPVLKRFKSQYFKELGGLKYTPL